MPARMSTFWFSTRSCTLAAAMSGWPVVSATITCTGRPATVLFMLARKSLKPSELSLPTLAIGPVSASRSPILMGAPPAPLAAPDAEADADPLAAADEAAGLEAGAPADAAAELAGAELAAALDAGAA